MATGEDPAIDPADAELVAEPAPDALADRPIDRGAPPVGGEPDDADADADPLDLASLDAEPAWVDGWDEPTWIDPFGGDPVLPDDDASELDDILDIAGPDDVDGIDLN